MADSEARLIWELYAAALKHEPAERSRYLERACDDAAIRAQVASLLESHGLDIGQARTGMTTDFGGPSAGSNLEGRRIGNYVIQRELGRGGMGIVYLAHDLRLSRTVAIKALSPSYSQSPTVRERLLNEAKMAASLSHPGIATVYALEEIDGELYLACEYVPGAPLRALVDSGPLEIADVIDIGLQLARALSEAHTKGIVHRDIKPENVIKTPSGVVKVLDFGLARADYMMQKRLTQTGMLVGTPAYLAPEQALGHDADFRTDIFALGLLLYELASGINPFAAKSIPATIASSTKTRRCCPTCGRTMSRRWIGSSNAVCERIRRRGIARPTRSSAISSALATRRLPVTGSQDGARDGAGSSTIK